MNEQTSATSLNIHQRMLAVMREVSYVQKSDKKVNNQYSFVTHDAVTAKLRASFVEHGILTTTNVWKHAQDGNRTEVDVTVAFINTDDPKDRVELQAFGYGIDPQDKGPGKAVSYAVKYAFLKAFALETGDDPERDSIDHKTGEVSKPGNGVTKPIPANIEGQEIYAAMSSEEKDYIRSHASSLIALHGKNGDLSEYVVGARLDHEEKLALWTQLPSDVRSAIKKQMKPTAAELASQA